MVCTDKASHYAEALMATHADNFRQSIIKESPVEIPCTINLSQGDSTIGDSDSDKKLERILRDEIKKLYGTTRI